MRSALTAVLVVVALLQPLAALVFVLDGVLIGAGDGRYLALAGVVTLAAYAPLAVLVQATHRDLGTLWAAFGVFIGARAVTLVARWRSGRWLPAPASHLGDPRHAEGPPPRRGRALS